MKTYTAKQVARLLDTPIHRIKYAELHGKVKIPRKYKFERYHYTDEDVKRIAQALSINWPVAV